MTGRVASFALTAIPVVSSFSLVVTILPVNVRASTLYMGGSGPGNDPSRGIPENDLVIGYERPRRDSN